MQEGNIIDCFSNFHDQHFHNKACATTFQAQASAGTDIQGNFSFLFFCNELSFFQKKILGRKKMEKAACIAHFG